MNRHIFFIFNGIIPLIAVVEGITSPLLSEENHSNRGDRALRFIVAKEEASAKQSTDTSAMRERSAELEKLKSSFDQQKQDLEAKARTIEELNKKQQLDVALLLEKEKDARGQLQSTVDALNLQLQANRATLEQQTSEYEKLKFKLDKQQEELSLKTEVLEQLKHAHAEEEKAYLALIEEQRKELKVKAKTIQEQALQAEGIRSKLEAQKANQQIAMAASEKQKQELEAKLHAMEDLQKKLQAEATLSLEHEKMEHEKLKLTIDELSRQLQASRRATEKQNSDYEKLKSKVDQQKDEIAFKVKALEQIRREHAEEEKVHLALIEEHKKELEVRAKAIREQKAAREEIRVQLEQQQAQAQMAAAAMEKQKQELEAKLHFMEDLHKKQQAEASFTLEREKIQHEKLRMRVDELSRQLHASHGITEKQLSDYEKLKLKVDQQKDEIAFKVKALEQLRREQSEAEKAHLAAIEEQKKELTAKTHLIEQLTIQRAADQEAFERQKSLEESRSERSAHRTADQNKTIAAQTEELKKLQLVLDSQKRELEAKAKTIREQTLHDEEIRSKLEAQQVNLQMVTTAFEKQKQELQAKAGELGKLKIQQAEDERRHLEASNNLQLELKNSEKELAAKSGELALIKRLYEETLKGRHFVTVKPSFNEPRLSDLQGEEFVEQGSHWNDLRADQPSEVLIDTALKRQLDNAGAIKTAFEKQKKELLEHRLIIDSQMKELAAKNKQIEGLNGLHEEDQMILSNQRSEIKALKTAQQQKVEELSKQQAALDDRKKELAAKNKRIQELDNQHEKDQAALVDRRNEIKTLKAALQTKEQELELAELKLQDASRKQRSVNTVQEKRKAEPQLKQSDQAVQSEATPSQKELDDSLLKARDQVLDAYIADIDLMTRGLTAQASDFDADGAPPASKQPFRKWEYSVPVPKRVTLRHVQGWGEGIGFGTNYSTAAVLLAPVYLLGHTLPLVDLRIHRFDNNTYAANVGLGARYLPEPGSFCQLLGFNAFYDFREGMKGNYSQLGVGIEVLGKRLDFRANVYYPIGVKKRHTHCVFDQYTGGYFIIQDDCEFTSYGFNAEVGYLAVDKRDFFLYAAAGPYYLARKCHDHAMMGGKVRIRPQYKDYFAVDLSYSYDSVFKSVFQAEVIVYLPLYQISSRKGKTGPCGITDRQIYQPIERFEVMPLGRRDCWQFNF